MQSREYFVAAEVADCGPRRFNRQRLLAVDDPSAQEVEVGRRLHSGEILERVGAERDAVRAHDAIVLVDPDDRRDVADRVQLGERVLLVDQYRKGDDLGPRTDVVDGFVNGDADDREIVLLELVMQGLPPGQVVTAPSPRGEGDKQFLLPAPLVE
jgi:hypothetical protein